MKRAILIALLLLAAAGASAEGPEEESAAQRELMQRRAAVEQKLKLAENMLFRSAGARRVAASGNEDALRLLAEARTSFTGARGALEAGNLAGADTLAAESLRQVGLAMRLVPEGGGETEQLRVRYARRLEALQGLRASLLRSAGREALSQPDVERVREIVGRAQEQAEKGDLAEAARAMDEAVELALKVAPRLMLARPVPQTGAAALEATSVRYQSYEDLLAIAELRANLPQDRATSLRSALDRARTLNIRAQDLALSGRYDEAITASQDAIAVLRDALRAAGVASIQ